MGSAAPAVWPRRRGWLSRPGFTLIELLIAMTVMVLLVSRGAPIFSAWVQNTQIRTAAEALQNGLQIARQQAVQLNTQVQMVLTGSDWTVSVVNPTSAIQSRTNSGDTPNASVASTQTTVVFNGLGRVTPSQAGVIVFGVSNPTAGGCVAVGGPMRCLNVTVQSGGQIRMCDPKLPVADPQSC